MGDVVMRGRLAKDKSSVDNMLRRGWGSEERDHFNGSYGCHHQTDVPRFSEVSINLHEFFYGSLGLHCPIE